jgi:hypothetical protein
MHEIIFHLAGFTFNGGIFYQRKMSEIECGNWGTTAVPTLDDTAENLRM